jgi:WD40 repeat protein
MKNSGAKEETKNLNKLPRIPSSILVGHVFPFLERNDWNNLSVCDKDMHAASHRHLPPWPSPAIVATATPVCSIAFSWIGTDLAVGCEDGTIQIWNQRTGNTHIFSDHTGTVTCLQYSRSCLASASQDHSVRLWSCTDYSSVAVLQGHERTVHTLAFSNDGSRVASAGWHGTIILWQTDTGECLQELNAHSIWVKSLGFSNSGKALYSASEDNTIRMWNLSTTSNANNGSPEIYHFITSAEAVAFSQDGNLFAISRGSDNSIDVFAAKDQTLVQKCQGHHSSGILALTFSKNSRKLASSSSEGMIHVWDLERIPTDNAGATNNDADVLLFHSDDVYALAFHPDATMLASGSDDCTFRLTKI